MRVEDVRNVVDELDTCGYSIVKNLLSSEVCDELTSNFPDDCYGLREILNIENIRRLASSARVVSLIEGILGSRVFATSGTFFNKIPAANWKVPWHQDRMIKVNERFEAEGWGPWSTKDGVIHVQPPESVISKVLAIRLHLDDCAADNGALRVITGSHRFGFLDPDQAAMLAAVSEKICPVSKGGALLMRPLLLHSSSPSRSATSRRVIHLEFAREDLPQPFEWRYRVA